jgi:hypothetical protein
MAPDREKTPVAFMTISACAPVAQSYHLPYTQIQKSSQVSVYRY